MRIRNLLTILFLSSCLVGCVSGANMENMAYLGSIKDYPNELRNNLEVASVVGGLKTDSSDISRISDEDFFGALKRSLSSQGLLSENGRYHLAARIIRVDHPLWDGLDMEVTTHVEYKITDSTNRKVIFKEKIIAPYTASVSDSFVGFNRLRLANEGSGKKNIEFFLIKISSLNIDKKEITLTK